MTFFDLFKSIKKEYNNQAVNLAIFFSLSKKVKSSKDLLISHKHEIDFNANDFYTALDDYYLHHKPLAHITHNTRFCDLDFIVHDTVHCPRNDTEIWVNQLLVLFLLDFESTKLIDLCAGSGCIGITLKKYFNQFDLSLLEIDEKAINNIKANLTFHHLDQAKIIQADFFNWIKNTNEKYDVIVMNPPYVDLKDLNSQMTKYENKISFNNSIDPLAFYKTLIHNLKKLIKDPNHFLVACEFGYDQKQTLKKLIDENGYKKLTTFYQDLNHQDRYFIIKK